MRAFFDDFSILQKENAMAEPGGGQPVGDEQGGFALGHVPIAQINLVFGNGVQGGGGFVQHQHRRVLVKRPSHHHLLGLAAGEAYSLGMHLGIQLRVHALGQAVQFFPHARTAQAVLRPAPVHIRAKAAGHSFCQREKRRLNILKNRGEQPVIILPQELVHRHAVDADFAGGGPVQPAQKFHQRGFARAVHAHQRQTFPGAEGEAHVVQGVLLRVLIAEGDVVEGNFRGVV